MGLDMYSSRKLSTQLIYSFKGLNRKRKGSLGEMEDMKNMSSDEYPCAAPRGRREKISEAKSIINTACAPDITITTDVKGITGIGDEGFYYNGELKSGKYRLRSDWKWTIVRKGGLYIMNGYDSRKKISVMYYYNIDADEFDEGGVAMHDLIVTTGKDFIRTLHYDDQKSKINDYEVTLSDGTVIANREFFKKYANGNTLDAENNIFAEHFNVGDEVTIEGFPAVGENEGQLWYYQNSSGEIKVPTGKGAGNNNTVDTDSIATMKNVTKYQVITATVKSFDIHHYKVDGENCYAHEIYFDLVNKNGDTVDFDILTTQPWYCSGISISRKKRVFTDIAIHQGRIWGSVPSGNYLYASASDDLFSFMSADISKKYGVRMTSDTPGAYTGLCSYNNELVAFKPDNIEIISGTRPTNYTMNIVPGIGCIAPKSVVSTPQGIIFLSDRGFYRYSGGTPICLSEKLNTRYQDAVSGFDGENYYSSTVKADGTREMAVYSLRYGIWHLEDDFELTGMFMHKGERYFADKYGLYHLSDPTNVEWEFTIAKPIAENYTLKGINEIWIKADINEGAEFTVETSVEDKGFTTHSTFTGKGLRVFRCPVRLITGEYYRIKLKGCGKVVIYEIELTKTDGGRRYSEKQEGY